MAEIETSEDAIKDEKAAMTASVDHSIAIAVQDATDLLRNISTMETTVIGVASAKWLADPANPAYEKIIKNATENITFAVETLSKVGEGGSKVIDKLSK